MGKFRLRDRSAKNFTDLVEYYTLRVAAKLHTHWETFILGLFDLELARVVKVRQVDIVNNLFSRSDEGPGPEHTCDVKSRLL